MHFTLACSPDERLWVLEPVFQCGATKEGRLNSLFFLCARSVGLFPALFFFAHLRSFLASFSRHESVEKARAPPPLKIIAWKTQTSDLSVHSRKLCLRHTSSDRNFYGSNRTRGHRKLLIVFHNR